MIRKSVLIIEDEPIQLEVLEKLVLEVEGHVAGGAEDVGFG